MASAVKGVLLTVPRRGTHIQDEVSRGVFGIGLR